MAMTPPQSALASCSASEKALILTQLLDGDPTLRKRAEDIARRILGSVDITTVSDLIVEAILELDTEDLANRAGPRRHGYVEPTRRGAGRIEPEPDRADRFILRVLETNPHAEPIRWPGSSIASIAQPIELGVYEDATPVRVCLLRQWAPDFSVETASWVERELNATIATSSPTGTSI